MIKLLIMDDGPLVQIGIKSILNRADYGVEVYDMAANGANALELIEEYSSEFVIIGIHMLITNGLELTKAYQETCGKILLFIILISYEEFQLAKEASSYQVVDYLVKLELDANILGESVGRMLERLEKLKAVEEVRSVGKSLLQTYHDKFFLRLFRDLSDSKEQFELQMRDLSLDSSGRCYVVVQCEIREESQVVGMEYEKLPNLHDSTIQMIEDILSKHLPCHVISLDMKYFVMLSHFSATKNTDLGKMMEALASVSFTARSYFNVWLFMRTDSTMDVLFEICKSLQNARMASAIADREHLIVNCNQVTPEARKGSPNVSVFRNDITQAFEEFDTDVLHDMLTQIMDVFAPNSMCYLWAIDGVRDILYLAISLLPEGKTTLPEISVDYSDGHRPIYRLGSVGQVLDWMKTLQDGLCETLKPRKVIYEECVITNVKGYIQNHIKERLTLSDVAGIFGLSSDYLSALFKKACDIGFSEYTTQMKINKAKTLLLEQGTKIYEAANELGPESAFYFNEVLKKVGGISPGEYTQQKTNSQRQYIYLMEKHTFL